MLMTEESAWLREVRFTQNTVRPVTGSIWEVQTIGKTSIQMARSILRPMMPAATPGITATICILHTPKLGAAGAMADMPDFKSGMPAFADRLADDEIHSVLEFIKSTWPEKIRDAQAEMSRRSAQ